MSARTITGTTGAWLTEYSHLGPEELKSFDGDQLVRNLSYAEHDMSASGWTRIGEATITLQIPDAQSLVDSKVEALRAQKQRVLADAQATATELESKIQKLLAITYEEQQ